MAAPKRPVKKGGKKKGASPRARKAGSSKLLILFTLFALVPFSLPTIIVLFCGMLPTVGAMLSERTGNKYSWMCVGGLNFAGLANWLLDLWFGHHDIPSAIHTATNLTMMLVSYGSAACGWILYMAIPPVILVVQTGSMSRRASSLASGQKKLLELWGDDIRRVHGTEE